MGGCSSQAAVRVSPYAAEVTILERPPPQPRDPSPRPSTPIKDTRRHVVIVEPADEEEEKEVGVSGLGDRCEPDGESQSGSQTGDGVMNFDEYVKTVISRAQEESDVPAHTKKLRQRLDGLIEGMCDSFHHNHKVFRGCELVKCDAWTDDMREDLPKDFDYIVMLHGLANEKVMKIYPNHDADPADLEFEHSVSKLQVLQDLPLQRCVDPKTKKKHFQQAKLHTLVSQYIGKRLANQPHLELLEYKSRFEGVFTRKRKARSSRVNQGDATSQPFYVLTLPFLHREGSERQVFVNISFAVPWNDDDKSVSSRDSKMSHVTISSILTNLQSPPFTTFTKNGKLRFSTQLDDDEIIRKLTPWSGQQKCYHMVMHLHERFMSPHYCPTLNRVEPIIPSYWIKTVTALRIRNSRWEEEWEDENLSSVVLEILGELRDGLTSSRLDTVFGSNILQEHPGVAQATELIDLEGLSAKGEAQLSVQEQQLENVEKLIKAIRAAQEGHMKLLEELGDKCEQQYVQVVENHAQDPRIYKYCQGLSVTLVKRRKRLVKKPAKPLPSAGKSAAALKEVTSAFTSQTSLREGSSRSRTSVRRTQSERFARERTVPDILSQLFQ